MAPSQLKSLKASLRQQGILGPQSSKKERQRGGKITGPQLQRRADALAGIREQFNPFEVKKLSRGAKHEYANDKSRDVVLGRPGITKGMGEEVRKNTLLQDLQRRQKAGGLVDRRFGEGDPTMSPEDRALQRFLREKQSQSRKASLFNLEDDADDDGLLTHKGRSLDLMDAPLQDDFDATGLEGSGDEADAEGSRRAKKRPRLAGENGELAGAKHAEPDADERPKTKKEVMEEVIAKSKLYRYERQQAKEDDEDLRDQLDSGMRDMLTALRSNGNVKAAPPKAESRVDAAMNPDRAALLAGKDRDELDREYDIRIRQLALEARAQPTTRTKTDEEKAEEEAQRLMDLEEKRLRRMRGESVSDEGREDEVGGDDEVIDEFDEENILGRGVPVQPPKDLDAEGEDDFLLEGDLIADGSDLEFESLSESGNDANLSDSDDQEFTAGLLSEEDAGRISLQPHPSSTPIKGTSGSTTLAFTYPCPQTHAEFLEVTKDTAAEDLHVIIQRIRALHHSRLAEENKSKLATFAAVLVQHLAYLAAATTPVPFATLEALIRHIHSLAKSYPTEVALAYQAQIQVIHTKRPLDLTPADLINLIGISTTFPTSDLFHPVATPAMMTLTRVIGQKIPRNLSELATGVFVCSLCLRYEAFAKRYVPEVTNYLLNTLSSLAPTPAKVSFGPFPQHEMPAELRIPKGSSSPLKQASRLQFYDILHDSASSAEATRVKHGLLSTTLDLASRIATLWAEKDSFPEIFQPFLPALKHLTQPQNAKCLAAVTIKTQIPTLHHTLAAQIASCLEHRDPLFLHNHRPLPIKTSIPKFEPNFNPAKHYDADEQRSASARLRKEHRRERKGAMRELRKDAAFIAREDLKQKITREKAQKDKERRLIAQIQTSEGAEGRRYEKEKGKRLGKR